MSVRGVWSHLPWGAPILMALVLVAVAAPWLAPHDPAAQNFDAILQGPSSDNWLGTDDLGRDTFSRLLYGARVSLAAPLLATGVALAVGIPLGLIAGFAGGAVDLVLMRIVDTLLSFPGVVLAVGVIAALGPGLVNAMTAMGIVFSPDIARLMRGQVLTVKESLYVRAARSMGSPASRTAVRHVLPNAIKPVLVQAAFLMGVAMIAEASLSFLGLGVQPPTASWGVMMRTASQFSAQAPLAVLPPGVALVLAVLAINSVGDHVRGGGKHRGRLARAALKQRRIESEMQSR